MKYPQSIAPKWLSSGFLILIALSLALASAVYTFKNRYYLRFIPLPLSLADTVNEGTWLLPSSQAVTPMGSLKFPANDLTTEQGLRKTLNYIQN